MPIRFIVFALLLVPASLQAQRLLPNRLPAGLTNPDSLRAWVPRPETADTVQLKQLINHSNQLIDTNLDSARILAQAAVALAWRRGQGHGLVSGLNLLASAYYYATNLPAAQRTYEQLLWAARRCQRPKMIGPAYMGMGNVARGLDNWVGAERYFVRAQQAYASLKPRDLNGELAVLANRAYNFLDIDSTASARPLVRQALARLRAFPAARHPAKYWLLHGLIQQKEQQFDSAAVTFGRAAHLAHATQDPNPEAEALLHLAELALRQQNYPLALRQAQQAEGLFLSLGDTQAVEALKTQTIALAALHRPEAYPTMRRYLARYDSVLRQQRVTAVANAQARFDQVEQQARIQVLEKQRRIADLEIEQRTFRSRVLLGTVGLTALLLAGLGGGTYRRRQATREATLRTRLAADLHDEVGGLLTQISLESALLQEGYYTPAQQHARLARVATASRSAARQMSDVVWSVDARNDSFASVLERMHDYAQELLPPAGIELEFSIPPALRAQPLSLLARQNLYLIFKEALHNVVKHAHATEVRVSFSLLKHQLRLEVRDNGRGGPTAEHPASHGLRNMRMRAAAVGGTVAYENAPAGFGVVVTLPV